MVLALNYSAEKTFRQIVKNLRKLCDEKVVNIILQKILQLVDTARAYQVLPSPLPPESTRKKITFLKIIWKTGSFEMRAFAVRSGRSLSLSLQIKIFRCYERNYGKLFERKKIETSKIHGEKYTIKVSLVSGVFFEHREG